MRSGLACLMRTSAPHDRQFGVDDVAGADDDRQPRPAREQERRDRAGLRTVGAADEPDAQRIRASPRADEVEHRSGQCNELRRQAQELRERERFAILELQGQAMPQRLAEVRVRDPLCAGQGLQSLSGGIDEHAR